MVTSTSSGRTTPVTNGVHSRRESYQSAPGSIVNSTTVQVVLRVRPSPSADQISNIPTRFQRTVVQSLNPTTLQLEQPNPLGKASGSGASKVNFTFDRVISAEEGQYEVYECAEPLVGNFLEGMNVTILAYGQTASGKSYTMGTDRSFDDEQQNSRRKGITPRAISDIFDRMKRKQKESKGGVVFSATLSYVEIYNEDLIDLLAGREDVRPTVQIREDKAGNIIWSGLKEVKVDSAAEVMDYLMEGSQLRQTGSTEMNAQSSRSHAIFSLTLTQRKYTGTGAPPPPPSPHRGNRQSMLPPRAGTPTNGIGANAAVSRLRPVSMSAKSSGPFSVPSEDGSDSWVNLTSKFHFVDLAGSERLKRTAAMDDRAKEGISINSGLLALGNVISALGDPARARQSTHIPYRDSKLTRLLQDSLGGNAQTMMIACVSPAEYNLNETISTVKYANRARNIKNRAEINEVEVGWDDVEYLQRTISKLRIEMSSLKLERGAGENGMDAIVEEDGGAGRRRALMDGATPKEIADRYHELTKGNAKLNEDLIAARAANGSNLSREAFAEAVEPIVEEYERSISALESQLSLTKAALIHQEDEMQDLEKRVEEEVRANEASVVLIGELKSRVARIGEREATTEAYVRDLESKLKDYDDLDASHGTAVSDMRKEITKNREHAEETEKYIKELEVRHSQSEDLATSLKRQIEVLERDLERREGAYQDLESRLSLLDTTGDHKLLLAEIDERDRKVLELERSLDDLQAKKDKTEAEGARLEQVAGDEKEQRLELERRLKSVQRASTVISNSNPSTPTTTSFLIPGATAGATLDTALLVRLKELQSTYDETLAELATANEKYSSSLQEIQQLNAQIEEAKLVQSEDGDMVPSPTSPNFGTPSSPALPQDDSDSESPAVPAQVGQNSTNGSPSRSPRARRSMPLSPQHRLSFLGRGQSTGHKPSLSQELSSSSASQFSSNRASSPSTGAANSQVPERTYDQMKNEVMKLQGALNDREEEISMLERKLGQIKSLDGTNELSESPTTDLLPAFSFPLRTDSITSRPVTLTRSESNEINLSPQTREAFTALKTEMGSEGGMEEGSSVRLDGIMRSMARKESAHRDSVELLNANLSTLRKQHDDLTQLSKDQVNNMSSEIAGLRQQLDGRPEEGELQLKLKEMEDALRQKTEELEQIREQSRSALSAATSSMQDDHQRTVERHAALTSTHSSEIEGLSAEHASRIEEQSTTHLTEVTRLQSEHATAMEQAAALHQKTIEEVSKSHITSANERIKRMEEVAGAQAASLLIEQHSKALSALRDGHQTTISNLTDSHSKVLEETRSSHTALEQSLLEAKANHSAASSRLDELYSQRNGLNHEPEHESLVLELQESMDALSTMEKALLESQEERERLLVQIQKLRTGSQADQKISTPSQDELSVKLTEELTQTRAERDLLRSQLSVERGSSVSSAYGSATSRSITPDDSATSDLSTAPPRIDSRNVLGSSILSGPIAKILPPSPPPSGPVPLPPISRSPSASSNLTTTVVRGINVIEAVPNGGRVRSSSISSDSTILDPRIAQKFAEQDATVARLTKQLAHCETDLKANIGLVETLESALNDSERSLRKARNLMTDLTKERDSFMSQNNELRQSIVEAHSEVATVRNSVTQAENREQQERQGKERAKAELEKRLAVVNSKKKSKWLSFSTYQPVEEGANTRFSYPLPAYPQQPPQSNPPQPHSPTLNSAYSPQHQHQSLQANNLSPTYAESAYTTTAYVDGGMRTVMDSNNNPPVRSARDSGSGPSGGRVSTTNNSNRRESTNSSNGGGSVSSSGNWAGGSGVGGNGGGGHGRQPSGPYARPSESSSLGGPSAAVKASSTTSEFTKRKNWSQHIIDEIQDFMHVLSPEGKIIFATPSIRELTGWTVEEVTNRPISDFIHADDIEGFLREYQNSIQVGIDLCLYYRFRMKDDRYTIFEITGHPYYAEENGQRRCKAFFGMGRPYPSKNTAMLDSFLELKIENERLRQELQVMYQDIEGNGGMADYTGSGASADYEQKIQPYPTSYEAENARYDPQAAFGATDSIIDHATGLVSNNLPPSANTYGALGIGYTASNKVDHVDKRKKVKGKTDDGEFVCRDCGTVDSPEWRKGPEGPKSLCNACGLRYAKLKSKGDKVKGDKK